MKNKNLTIALIYGSVALLCAAIVAVSMWLQSNITAKTAERLPAAVDTGKETKEQWFPITNDLTAVNQENQPVKLSDLRGKVWVVAEFFAVCPRCASRNGAELHEIYDEFKGDPDFHIACISVDPVADKSEKLADYAKALGADSKNWWFLNAGDVKATHQYLEHELKFMGIRERIDPLDVESNGRYAHDMAFTLVDRDFNVIGKWNLTEAKSEEGQKVDPDLYKKTRQELFERIRKELAKNKTAEK